MLMQSVDDLRAEAEEAIRATASLQALHEVEVRYLGRSGKVTEMLKHLKEISPDERKHTGPRVQELKKLLELMVVERTATLKREEYQHKLHLERIDVTEPGVKYKKGGLHPLTIIRRDIERIFMSMGFAIAEGPEIETEFYNFDALNIPADHPARDMWDTFWLKGDEHSQKTKTAKKKGAGNLLLRTHTSPVQIRYMQTHQPPFRIIAPGKVFRYEATDASHEIQFYQLEGLMVGRDVSLAHFKQIMQTFLSKLFGKRMKVRLRPSYFPFVEPGVEVDMSCVQCGGHGCSVCKRTGWVEIAGAGMVHPKVFEAAGLNPKECQGFAFGFGIDRVALMKYKIPDIRLFYQNDVRFLRQF